MKFRNRFDQKYKETPDVFGYSPMPVLEKAVEIVSSGKALDLRVGNGRNTLYLLEKGFEVTGVDMSEEGIKVLKSRITDSPKLKLFVSDVTKFETQEKFDLICATGLLHFLNKEQIDTLIEKMKGFTKKGGINVVGAKMTQNLRKDLPYVFKPGELKEMYERDDWHIEYYEEILRQKGKLAALIARRNVTVKTTYPNVTPEVAN